MVYFSFGIFGEVVLEVDFYHPGDNVSSEMVALVCKVAYVVELDAVAAVGVCC